MPDEYTGVPVSQFGSGRFEFREWNTPFANAHIEVIELAFSPTLQCHDDDIPRYRDQSLLRVATDKDLTARIYVYDSNTIYRVVFSTISAFRLLDEHGLIQFWTKTEELGGRPAKTTFQVRNHLWTEESTISFFLGTDEGWSFVIASDNDCLEVLSQQPPLIVEESVQSSVPKGDSDRQNDL